MGPHPLLMGKSFFVMRKTMEGRKKEGREETAKSIIK